MLFDRADLGHGGVLRAGRGESVDVVEDVGCAGDGEGGSAGGLGGGEAGEGGRGGVGGGTSGEGREGGGGRGQVPHLREHVILRFAGCGGWLARRKDGVESQHPSAQAGKSISKRKTTNAQRSQPEIPQYRLLPTPLFTL